MAQKRLIAGLLWSLGHLHSVEALTRVPTQVTCRIFKKRPGRGGPGGVPSKGGRSISAYRLPSTPILGLVLLRFALFAAGAEQLGGAQYSQGLWAVNAASENNSLRRRPPAKGLENSRLYRFHPRTKGPACVGRESFAATRTSLSVAGRRTLVQCNFRYHCRLSRQPLSRGYQRGVERGPESFTHDNFPPPDAQSLIYTVNLTLF